MACSRSSAFIRGLTVGTLGSVITGVVIVRLSAPAKLPDTGLQAVDDALAWTYANLGLSLPVFALLLLLYLHSLRKLKQALDQDVSIELVAQSDQMVDIWTSLFFGVGVIWTAIGMRSALVFALGETASTFELGAYAILQRMVDGGILLALSTTIFGGIGGYLLRVVKALSVETELKRYYDRMAHAPGVRMEARLRSIDTNLQELVRRIGHPKATD